MNLEGASRPQKSARAERASEERGEAPTVGARGEASSASQGHERSGSRDLMERVTRVTNLQAALKRVEDNAGKRVLRLIRGYLSAGMMADGVVIEREEGTPQGGPLSPLLANVLLDEVDQELERTGHAFARYADDCNVYVHSTRAGERVMERLKKLYGKLRLRINEDKSAVASAFERDFLGFGFWVAPGGEVKLRASKKALRKLKERVRKLTRRSSGRSLEQVAQKLSSYLHGWRAYFRLAHTPGVWRTLDEWIRHRMRVIQLKHWKRGRTAFRELRARGVEFGAAIAIARHVRSWWGSSNRFIHVALQNRFFDELEIPRLAD